MLKLYEPMCQKFDINYFLVLNRHVTRNYLLVTTYT
jgi:hypothetical protein